MARRAVLPLVVLLALVTAVKQDTLSTAKLAIAAAAYQLEPCALRASSTCPVRVAIALDGSSQQSKACLLQSLGGKGASAAAWCLAAHHFPGHAGIAQHTRSLLRGQLGT